MLILEDNGHKINRIDCYETIENEKLKEHIKNLQVKYWEKPKMPEKSL